MNSLVFNHIGIIVGKSAPVIHKSTEALIDFLISEGKTVYIEEQSLQYLEDMTQLGKCHILNSNDFGKLSDLVIVFGGDGSILSAARSIVLDQKPIIGVNRGRLGFLAQIPGLQALETLKSILSGEYILESRSLLRSKIIRAKEIVDESIAFNDVAISRGGLGKMINFEVFIDNEFVYTQHSDGLIVSTPTGSTAYSLAAGGPILHSKLAAISLVPICPQSMTNRPVVVHDSSKIEILITQGLDARVHFDGQTFFDLQNLDVIAIEKYEHSIQILQPVSYRYYKTLRQKLRWGEQLI